MASPSEQLLSKLKTLNETIWDHRVSHPKILEWLSNFSEEENNDALYLLANTMYFGKREIDELVKSVYRDLFKYPIVERIRKSNNDTIDSSLIEQLFNSELSKTRFLALGNVSESSSHLLYNFRLVNDLPPAIFVSSDQVLKTARTQTGENLENVTRFIFFDDLCGGGTQAVRYASEIVSRIKEINANVEFSYFCLFGTVSGLNYIKENSRFDRVEAIFELDDSFRCFSDSTRYFLEDSESRDRTMLFCKKHGEIIEPSRPLGYRDGQLLITFFHNTPDNTLPIFWSNSKNWFPVFERKDKNYQKL